MKFILILIVVLLVLALMGYVFMAIQSQNKPDTLGLKNDILRPCPDTPNCVCSEEHSLRSEQHAVAPISLAENTWESLKQQIIDQGGSIEVDDGSYVHAIFTSNIFRFVDDMELRLDTEEKLIHIRSSSRVGRSDFGANRKRVESLFKQ